MPLKFFISICLSNISSLLRNDARYGCVQDIEADVSCVLRKDQNHMYVRMDEISVEVGFMINFLPSCSN